MVDVPDFDALYRSDPDPWQVAESFYERRKQAVLLACLTRPHYGAAWDPGCGTGELAAALAARADAVLATDSSVEAVRLTAGRCAQLTDVVTSAQLRQPARPELPPRAPHGFDLTVVAEFAYYLTGADRAAFWDVVDASAAPTAEVVIVHWRHRPHDAYLSGLDVTMEGTHRLTEADHGWEHQVRHDDRDFVLDVLVREAR
jgi:SAM-dependent methyltransferase